MRAFIGLVLQSAGYQIRNHKLADDDVASIWVTDDAGHDSCVHAERFLQRGEDRRLVVIGNGALMQANGDHRITRIPVTAKPSEIRSRLVTVAQSLRAGGGCGE
jgi:hypothetical protein